ncbi:MAG: hypothetical protein RL758_784 [Pseudomonadota bacterium]|jgi:predicted alpha/beta-fold hydrolase
MLDYSAPVWLPGGHAQTIWSAKLAHRGPRVTWQRERWGTPDGDFIDVDFVHPPGVPKPSVLLVLFHGLEGSRHSHYAQALGVWAQERGVVLALPHFRGCSGDLNLAPRAYHSGDHEEVGWVLDRFARQFPAQRRVALGVSLGGNALLRWAEEAGCEASQRLAAVSSVCSPIDLRASGLAIGRGFSRWVYTPMFLRSMKPKALRKWHQFPGLFDKQAMLTARDLHEFDNVFTAPLHGFRDTDDYWLRASAKPHLHRIRIPALVVNALNDPFVPAASLPASVPGDWVRLWQPATGGHVGFARGAFPGHLQALPQTAGQWLLDQTRS